MMTDKLINCERELKLGASFSCNKATQYHTIKYDFKPASVDINKMATVDVSATNQVTVTLDGAGVPQTVFKGNQRPYTKECVLIIDKVTGEITLEKLSSNIQVKKTRQESTTKPGPLTPAELTNTTQRSSSRTRVTSGVSRRINPVGGAVSAPRYPGAPQKSPPMLVRSPPRIKTSPPQAAPWSGGHGSTLASLPMIGLDESPMHNGYSTPVQVPPVAPARPAQSDRGAGAHQHERNLITSHTTQAPVPVISADQNSSSSSSDSGSDSGSDSDSEDDTNNKQNNTLLSNGSSQGSSSQPPAPLLSDVLNDDLCLSESGSESD